MIIEVMHTTGQLQKFDVNTLAQLEPVFDLRFFSDVKSLQSSVQMLGVLQPPCLYKKGSDFFVLDGYHRIQFAKQRNYTSLACHVISADESTFSDVFLHYLELNRWSRSFNIVEKAFILKKAHEVFQNQGIPKAFWSIVDIPQKIHMIQSYKNLLKLPRFILKYLVNNNMSIKAAIGFLNFPKEEAEKLATQLFVYPLNQNKLIEILDILHDLKKHEERSAVVILSEVLEGLAEINPQQRERALRECLKERRNPHYQKRMASFQSKVKKIPLDAETSLSPAPFFEEDYIEVRSKISSKDDIQKLISALKHRGWEDLFKP